MIAGLGRGVGRGHADLRVRRRDRRSDDGDVIFGLGIGAASTAAYTAAGAVIPAEARGAGFGLLSTGSLIGLATSPIICGLLGTLSLRAVFVLDTVALLFVAGLVRRLMAMPPTATTPAPATEEV